jgi:hypothetical protein
MNYMNNLSVHPELVLLLCAQDIRKKPVHGEPVEPQVHHER